MYRPFNLTITYSKGNRATYEGEAWEYDPPRTDDRPMIGKTPIQGNYWYPSKVWALRNTLKTLTDDERIEFFSEYCYGCGCDDPYCHCMNDE